VNASSVEIGEEAFIGLLIDEHRVTLDSQKEEMVRHLRGLPRTPVNGLRSSSAPQAEIEVGVDQILAHQAKVTRPADFRASVQ